jgi:hypothetical protein
MFSALKITNYSILFLLFIAPVFSIDCGERITKSIILEKDLINCPHVGLYIENHNVEIDCNYKTISGNGEYAGIYIQDFSTINDVVFPLSNIKIKNCNINNFQAGIVFVSAKSSIIYNNQINSTIVGIAVYSGKNKIDNNVISAIDYGIIAYDNFNEISNNNISSDVEAIFLMDQYNSLMNNHIFNSNLGIHIIGDNNRFIKNSFSNITYGVNIKGDNNEFKENNFENNSNAINVNSNNNKFEFNYILNNLNGFIIFGSNSTLNNNIICNQNMDIFNVGNNFGLNNTCSNIYNWKDEGQNNSCTFSCQSKFRGKIK